MRIPVITLELSKLILIISSFKCILPEPKTQWVMKFNNFPTEHRRILINKKWFAGTPTLQTRNNGGSGFCNAHVYETILIIINTIHLPDIHRQNTVIHHWLLEEMLTTQGWSWFLSFSVCFRICTNTRLHTKALLTSLKQFSFEAVFIDPCKKTGLHTYGCFGSLTLLVYYCWLLENNSQRPFIKSQAYVETKLVEIS